MDSRRLSFVEYQQGTPTRRRLNCPALTLPSGSTDDRSWIYEAVQHQALMRTPRVRIGLNEFCSGDVFTAIAISHVPFQCSEDVYTATTICHTT
jgi:ribonuclease HIII